MLAEVRPCDQAVFLELLDGIGDPVGQRAHLHVHTELGTEREPMSIPRGPAGPCPIRRSRRAVPDQRGRRRSRRATPRSHGTRKRRHRPSLHGSGSAELPVPDHDPRSVRSGWRSPDSSCRCAPGGSSPCSDGDLGRCQVHQHRMRHLVATVQVRELDGRAGGGGCTVAAGRRHRRAAGRVVTLVGARCGRARAVGAVSGLGRRAVRHDGRSCRGRLAVHVPEPQAAVQARRGAPAAVGPWWRRGRSSARIGRVVDRGA